MKRVCPVETTLHVSVPEVDTLDHVIEDAVGGDAKSRNVTLASDVESMSAHAAPAVAPTQASAPPLVVITINLPLGVGTPHETRSVSAVDGCSGNVTVIVDRTAGHATTAPMGAIAPTGDPSASDGTPILKMGVEQPSARTRHEKDGADGVGVGVADGVSDDDRVGEVDGRESGDLVGDAVGDGVVVGVSDGVDEVVRVCEGVAVSVDVNVELRVLADESDENAEIEADGVGGEDRDRDDEMEVDADLAGEREGMAVADGERVCSALVVPDVLARGDLLKDGDGDDDIVRTGVLEFKGVAGVGSVEITGD